MQAQAAELYEQALSHGQRQQIWSLITGRARGLLALAGVQAACTIRGRHDLGNQWVPLDQIRGSESRVMDFDASFWPLQDHTRTRWLHVAEKWLAGGALPPVELIRVGELYFVRDGHHRISVARALGQAEIEAVVTEWQACDCRNWPQQPRSRF